VGTEGLVEVEGGTLYYERDGDGPAVVLISGGFQDVRMYAPQVEALSRRHSLIRCDLRGFGRSSEPGNAAYRHCDDLRHLLEALGIDRAVNGGQSLGGTVALDFAFAYPDLVRGLVLAPALPVLGWDWVEGFPVAPALKLGRSEGVDAFRAAFLELPLTASTMAIPEVAESLRQMVTDYSGWHLRHQDAAGFEAPDAVRRLHEVDAPALVLVGGHDVLDSRLVAERLASDLAHAEHHLIEHVGHAPTWKTPPCSTHWL
jgi:pimeloyl-ACP methyl ester carboxylesterase